jgi:hypothetical protein
MVDLNTNEMAKGKLLKDLKFVSLVQMYDKQYRVMQTFEERADEIVFLKKTGYPICCEMELVPQICCEIDLVVQGSTYASKIHSVCMYSQKRSSKKVKESKPSRKAYATFPFQSFQSSASSVRSCLTRDPPHTTQTSAYTRIFFTRRILSIHSTHTRTSEAITSRKGCSSLLEFIRDKIFSIFIYPLYYLDDHYEM